MFRKFLPLLIGAAAAVATPAAAGPRLSGDEELARALEGRVAGEPVSCLNLRTVRSSRVISHTAILFRQGDTIYVNRPRSGADILNRWDTQVVRTPNNRLCSIDTVEMVDPTSGIMSGVVFLGEFVPYRRVGAGD